MTQINFKFILKFALIVLGFVLIIAGAVIMWQTIGVLTLVRGSLWIRFHEQTAVALKVSALFIAGMISLIAAKVL